jgi:hypothetical protein
MTAPASERRTKSLWLGVGISPFAWFATGIADMFITWRACLHEAPFGEPASNPAARGLYFIFTLLLLATAAVAVVWSYRNWHRLTDVGRLLETEGRNREEFMALAGVFIGFTLGVGIVWLCLPLFVIQMCLRAR